MPRRSTLGPNASINARSQRAHVATPLAAIVGMAIVLISGGCSLLPTVAAQQPFPNVVGVFFELYTNTCDLVGCGYPELYMWAYQSPFYWFERDVVVFPTKDANYFNNLPICSEGVSCYYTSWIFDRTGAAEFTERDTGLILPFNTTRGLCWDTQIWEEDTGNDDHLGEALNICTGGNKETGVDGTKLYLQAILAPVTQPPPVPTCTDSTGGCCGGVPRPDVSQDVRCRCDAGGWLCR